jgi:dUTP pyrophosphatase
VADLPKVRGFEVVSGYEDKAVLPVRKTEYSAGYDLHSAETIAVESIWKQASKVIASLVGFGEFKNLPLTEAVKMIKPTIVKTGIKAYMQPDEYLHLVNRSSGPIKRGLIYAPGAGIIDADYYNAPETEGHIMLQFYNFGVVPYTIRAGESVAQVTFQNYLVADNDVPGGKRTGGFGSTGK